MASGQARTDREWCVLLVDDDKTHHKLFDLVCRRHEIRTLHAYNSKGAKRMFAKHHGELDAVLLDILMPDATGYATAAMLRRIEARWAEPPSRQIPIIACSGLPRKEIWERCRKSGMNDLIGKGLGASDFECVVAWCRGQGPKGAGATGSAVPDREVAPPRIGSVLEPVSLRDMLRSPEWAVSVGVVLEELRTIERELSDRGFERLADSARSLLLHKVSNKLVVLRAGRALELAQSLYARAARKPAQFPSSEERASLLHEAAIVRDRWLEQAGRALRAGARG